MTSALQQATGEWIVTGANQQLIVPNEPNIGLIEGDGIGPDIWAATRKVLDAAVFKACSGKRKIHWVELPAGEKAFRETGQGLPESTIDGLRRCIVAIKGPLTTS